MVLINPFTFKEIDPDSPFCNRQQEQRDLLGYARANANVVLFSPRRYGKTSLVKRVQKELGTQGYLTLFTDFFGITSAEEAAFRLARAFFEMTRKEENWFKKSIRLLKSFRPVLKPDDEGKLSLTVELATTKQKGLETIEEVLGSLDEFARDKKIKIQIVFDEFQEIVLLKESLSLEGIMRSHIQKQPISYFFVGSRRRLLLDMFNERKRPFFQSALNYELKALPHEELAPFLVDQFQRGKKECPLPVAEKISSRVHQHPYYAQKLSFFVFETAEKKVNESDLKPAFDLLINAEKPVFEAILQGLAPQQIVLLKALALDPSPSLFSFNYIKAHHLGSTGGIQGALKKLIQLDLIEKREKGFDVVDPLLRHWLSHQ